MMMMMMMTVHAVEIRVWILLLLTLDVVNVRVSSQTHRYDTTVTTLDTKAIVITKALNKKDF